MKHTLYLLLILLISATAFGDCCDDLVIQLSEIRVYSQDSYALKEMLQNKLSLLERAESKQEKEIYQLTTLYLKLKMGTAAQEDFEVLNNDSSCSLLLKPLVALTFSEEYKQAGFDSDLNSLLALYDKHKKVTHPCYYHLHILCRVQNEITPQDKNPICMDADGIFMTQDPFTFKLHTGFRRFVTTELKIKPKSNLKLDLLTGKDSFDRNAVKEFKEKRKAAKEGS